MLRGKLSATVFTRAHQIKRGPIALDAYRTQIGGLPMARTNRSYAIGSARWIAKPSSALSAG